MKMDVDVVFCKTSLQIFLLHCPLFSLSREGFRAQMTRNFDVLIRSSQQSMGNSCYLHDTVQALMGALCNCLMFSKGHWHFEVHHSASGLHTMFCMYDVVDISLQFNKP